MTSQDYQSSLLPLPKDDYLYQKIFWFANNEATCRLCGLCRDPEGDETLPNFYMPHCKSWYHDICLLDWLSQDGTIPIPCGCCRRIHHHARWAGRILCSLRQRYPGSTLPNIRSRISREELEFRLLRVKSRDQGPWFGDMMPLCEEPEETDKFQCQKTKDQISLEKQDVMVHRRKADVRFARVRNYRNSIKAQRATVIEKIRDHTYDDI